MTEKIIGYVEKIYTFDDELIIGVKVGHPASEGDNQKADKIKNEIDQALTYYNHMKESPHMVEFEKMLTEQWISRLVESREALKLKDMINDRIINLNKELSDPTLTNQGKLTRKPTEITWIIYELTELLKKCQ